MKRFTKTDEIERAPVYLFAGEAGYLDHTLELLESPDEHTAGVHLRNLGQLKISEGTEHKYWAHTVRHEGFHQFLDQLAPTAPVWFHEGMAEYYSSAEKLQGRWNPGYAYPHHLAILLERGTIPLSRLLRLESGAFMRDAALHYAQAWAFVHLLQHGANRRHKDRFDVYLDALIDGAGAEATLNLAFPKEALADLDRRLKAHIKELHLR